MGLKEYMGVLAAGSSVVFGWVAAQDQLCNMRLARPICLEPPAQTSTPLPASAPASETATPPPAATAPASTPPAVQAPPPPAPPQPMAMGSDLSGASGSQTAHVPQANITPELAAQLESRIREYLTYSAGNAAPGFRPAANDAIVAMQPATSYNMQVTLSAGVLYRVLGACDDDCKAIALEAYDSNGARIAGSDGSGDFPVLELTPLTSGQYTMRVRLVQCEVAPCYVGVRVVQR